MWMQASVLKHLELRQLDLRASEVAAECEGKKGSKTLAHRLPQALRLGLVSPPLVAASGRLRALHWQRPILSNCEMGSKRTMRPLANLHASSCHCRAGASQDSRPNCLERPIPVATYRSGGHWPAAPDLPHLAVNSTLNYARTETRPVSGSAMRQSCLIRSRDSIGSPRGANCSIANSIHDLARAVIAAASRAAADRIPNHRSDPECPTHAA